MRRILTHDERHKYFLDNCTGKRSRLVSKCQDATETFVETPSPNSTSLFSILSRSTPSEHIFSLKTKNKKHKRTQTLLCRGHCSNVTKLHLSKSRDETRNRATRDAFLCCSSREKRHRPILCASFFFFFLSAREFVLSSYMVATFCIPGVGAAEEFSFCGFGFLACAILADILWFSWVLSGHISMSWSFSCLVHFLLC